jgi:hypothetical protein
MRLVVLQYQRPLLQWCVSPKRRNITERDRVRVARAVAKSAKVETGYYDLVLTDHRDDFDATIEVK